MTRSVTLTAVGDICLPGVGCEHPSPGLEEVLDAADILFGCLDTPPATPPAAEPRVVPTTPPSQDVGPLEHVGFGLMHVTSDHTSTSGASCFHETVRTLQSRGIAVLSRRPPGDGVLHASVDREGLRLGFLGYTERHLEWTWNSRGQPRSQDRRILRDVRAVRSRCDVLVVSLQWGVEGAAYPSPGQIRMGRRLIECGVDVVLGHHPKVVQGVERYRGGLIAYSLGTMLADPRKPFTDESFALTVRVGPRAVHGYELTPLAIRSDGAAERMVGADRDIFLARVDQLSSPITEGRLSEVSWFRRIASRYVRRNLLPAGGRIGRSGIREGGRFLASCFDPFNRRCLQTMLRSPVWRRTRDGSSPIQSTGSRKESSAPERASFPRPGRSRTDSAATALEIVEVAGPEAFERWSGLETASPFITPRWLEAYRSPGRSPIYLRFVCQGTTVGAIGGLVTAPRYGGLVRAKLLQKLFFFSGPAVPGYDRHLVARCVDQLCRFADTRRIPSIALRSWGYPVAYLCSDDRFVTQKRQEYIVDLRDRTVDLLAGMSRNRRDRVRLARRSDMVFRVSRQREDLIALDALLENTRARRVGKGHPDYDAYYLPYTSHDVLERLLDSGVAGIACAERDGETHAAILFARQGPRAHTIFIGVSPLGYATGAGDLLFLDVMETLRGAGVEQLNLGTVPPVGGAGLAHYKESLGARRHTCTGGEVATPRAELVRGIGGLRRGRLRRRSAAVRAQRPTPSSVPLSSGARPAGVQAEGSGGFLRDVATYLPAQVAPALVALVSIPVITSLFAPSQYGVLSIALATVAIAVTLLGWIPTAVVRFHPAAEKENRLPDFLGTVQTLTVLSITVACALGAALLLVFGKGLSSDLRPLLWVGLALLATETLFFTFQGVLRTQRQARQYSLFAVLKSVGNLALGLFLVLALSQGVEGLLWGSVAAGLLLVPYVRRRALGRQSLWTFRLDRQLTAAMAKYSTPLVIGNVAAWALHLSDRYVLESVRDSHEVGIYSVSYDIGSRSTMLVVMLFRLASGPIAMRIWEREGPEQSRFFVRDVTRYLLMLCVVAVTGLAVLSRPLMEVMAGEEFIEGYHILGLVGAGILLLGLQSQFQAGLLFHKKTLLVTIAMVAAGGVNIGLNLLFIPRFGYVAAAVTSLVSYAVLLGIIIVFSRRYFVWPFPFRTLMRVAVAAGIMAASIHWVVEPITTSAVARLTLGTLVGITVYALALLLLGEIRPSEKKAVVRLLHRLVLRGRGDR